MTRLQTVRLERYEWSNIIAVAITEVGEEPLKTAFRAALGEERANRYIEEQAGEPFTKRDTHALVRELYPIVPGAAEPNPALATREDKTGWIKAQARRCFVKVEGGVAVPDDARIAEVFNYALDRVEEFEAAGGTLEKFPDPPPPPPSTLTGEEPGFLWKPIGEHSKALRVLLPPAFTGKIDLTSCQLFYDGGKIETLAALGVANGNRQHFAGVKPGGAYSLPVHIRAIAENVTWNWTISFPGARTENIPAERVDK